MAHQPRAAHNGNCGPFRQAGRRGWCRSETFPVDQLSLGLGQGRAATESLKRGMGRLRLRRSKLTAPDRERFAGTPCPTASLASSGISALSSPLARSWWRKVLRVLRKSAANCAQEFDALISTMRMASRPRWLAIDQVRRFAGLHTAPELLFRRHQNAEIERVHGDRDLDPFAASSGDREH
jgi:hypothetical protein